MDTTKDTISAPNHLILLVLLLLTISRSSAFHRRFLQNHALSSSSPQPSPHPEYPTSTGEGKRTPPFFPSGSSPPALSPALSPRNESIPITVPANVSSVIFPQSHSSSKPRSTRLVTAACVSPIVIIFVLLAIFFYRRRQRRPTSDTARKAPRSDSLQLHSTDRRKPPRGGSSEFLYLGTLVNSRIGHDTDSETVSPGQKLGSPELCPLPPLPRLNFQQDAPSNKEGSSSKKVEKEEEEEDVFYSPKGFVERVFLNPQQNPLNSASPSHSSCNNTVSASSTLNSTPSSSISNSAPRFSVPKQHTESIPPPPRPPPPPPPPPPSGHWKTPVITPEPQVSIIHNRPNNLCESSILHDSSTGEPQNSASMEMKNDVIPKPKLKPLHWDKVKASSGRAMVWDRLKSSSFKLNEDMIETLFMVSGSNSSHQKNLVTKMQPQDNHVLDQKKSQNIAILLRALNVTVDEVCEALLEGNADALGSELLESLLKMGPTKEEERELRAFKDDSPIKLGPAERFLKTVIDIPFAFKRVNAMLYVSNFDSEAEYLNRCFETLEAACGELRSSRMFLKLLEAVLKTGNRMNVGTNRGDAHAFQLGTLLKLVDVKGADGKTTLLHFVVQEIMRAEASRSAAADSRAGLQLVCGLSNELSNVKKAAAMDSDTLCNDVVKLAQGLVEVRNIAKLIKEAEAKEACNERRYNFCDSMNGFLQRAEEEIVRIETQKGVALNLTKELTVYFHGDSVREDAHPSRIFMVVGDFLCSLDRVCKEVGKINDGNGRREAPVTTYGANTSVSTVIEDFKLSRRHEFSSSDDESESSISPLKS